MYDRRTLEMTPNILTDILFFKFDGLIPILSKNCACIEKLTETQKGHEQQKPHLFLA